MTQGPSTPPLHDGSAREMFLTSLRLGLTSFGGPIAHLGYFRREYVVRRRWLDESAYADIIALCQLLPGPTSSQVGIAIGTRRAGLRGGVAAWLGFTLPAATALALLGTLAASMDIADAGWVRGLKLAAVAVVAQAIIAMTASLAPDWPRRAMAAGAALLALAWATAYVQVLIIAAGALVGVALLAPTPGRAMGSDPIPLPRRLAVVSLLIFGGLLIAAPFVRTVTGSYPVALFEGMFRTGALVFGGGHVVLPLLQPIVVDPGWVTQSQFIAGYGAAQAVPGPLFTFSAYLGAVSSMSPAGGIGAVIAVCGIFLSSFLLVWGALPFWDLARSSVRLRRALAGTNAAVLGLLIAAFYDPVWVSAIHGAADVLIALGAFVLLVRLRSAPVLVIGACMVAGELVSLLPGVS